MRVITLAALIERQRGRYSPIWIWSEFAGKYPQGVHRFACKLFSQSYPKSPPPFPRPSLSPPSPSDKWFPRLSHPLFDSNRKTHFSIPQTNYFQLLCRTLRTPLRQVLAVWGASVLHFANLYWHNSLKFTTHNPKTSFVQFAVQLNFNSSVW